MAPTTHQWDETAPVALYDQNSTSPEMHRPERAKGVVSYTLVGGVSTQSVSKGCYIS